MRFGEIVDLLYVYTNDRLNLDFKCYTKERKKNVYNTVLQHPSYYRVGLYIRLSESDSNKSYESESESIINQRDLLMSFVKQNEFTFVDEYIDDGFTGTNFDRPGFKRLIDDIEKGRINCVITKDLSRLGRNYVTCGYYVDEYFLLKKVRYIAVLDQVDTFLNNVGNEMIPFKSVFNDMTSRDNSKKIRSILRNKKEDGKFIGSEPSFGYVRDPEVKGHLLPNPETAFIVKKIFKMSNDGKSVSDIASYLNDCKYPTPSLYKKKEGSKQKVNPIWTISSVKKILKNQMYTGDMVQNVQTKLSYKSPKKVTLNKEAWIIVPNTHEPLVSKEVFFKVQNNVKRKPKTQFNREKRLFENLIYCKECGNTLTVTYRKKQGYWTINCNRYSRDPRRHLCYPHFMSYDKLEEALLATIKNTCKKYLDKLDIKALAKLVNDKNSKKESNMAEINYLNKRIKECNFKIDMLYDDKFKGNISEDTYKRLSRETEILLNQSKARLEELQSIDKKKIDSAKGIKKYEEKIKELINLDKPSRELLQSIIDKIIIDKDRNIEIFYEFGMLNNI